MDLHQAPKAGGRPPRPSRRDVLRAGGGLAALSCLPAAAGAVAERARFPGFGRADSCILVFLGGGPSHLDTFDPKPDAPSEVRGAFGSIPTSVPGLRVSEHLPRLARQAHRWTVIRSLSHDELEHEPAVHRVLTGRPLDPATGPSPHWGARLQAEVDSPGSGPRPGFVAVPDYLDAFGPVLAGQGAGPLGPRFEPVVLRANPTRLDVRGDGPVGDHAETLRRAAAYTEEPDRVIERYGPTLFGRSALVGRRLVEAGAKVVQVNAVRHLGGGWDTHADGFDALRRGLLPTLDQALSALLADLDERGRLDRTLVVVVGEFGRSPWVNATAGRDHWSRAFSALVAGAGIPPGRALGATDAVGAEPVDRPISPARLVASIGHALGDPRPADRPIAGLWDTPFA